MYLSQINATQGSCRYLGCTDPNAVNWSSNIRNAIEDESSDLFLQQRSKVSSGCEWDSDQGVVNQNHYGCCEYQCGSPGTDISNPYTS